MHAAPSVSYPVGRSRFAGALALVLVLAGLAALAAWCSEAAALGWRQAAAGGALVAAAAVAARAWAASPSGVLRWDGQGWTWNAAGGACGGRLALALDLQRRLLLRWHGDGDGHGGAPRWLWAERDAAPADWDALRRAVYSRADDAAPQGAQPPAAER